MRLIDADALINNLEMLICEQEEDDHVETWNNAITCVINEVKHHAPTIDAEERKKGAWIVDYKFTYMLFPVYCSNCHRMGKPTDNYCPNCGARMDEGGNHETH